MVPIGPISDHPLCSIRAISGVLVSSSGMVSTLGSWLSNDVAPSSILLQDLEKTTCPKVIIIHMVIVFLFRLYPHPNIQKMSLKAPKNKPVLEALSLKGKTVLVTGQ
jgi:hypothetical protein